MSPGSTASDTQLRSELAKLRKSVEALEAVIRTQSGQVTVGIGQRGITIKKNGDIVINGNNVETIASGHVSIKAAKDLILKGTKILEN